MHYLKQLFPFSLVPMKYEVGLQAVHGESLPNSSELMFCEIR